MKISLKENTLSLKVRYADRQQIKDMGFVWNTNKKEWFTKNADKLSAVQVLVLQKLEKDWTEEMKESEDRYAGLMDGYEGDM
jgi:hypothetical protein